MLGIVPRQSDHTAGDDTEAQDTEVMWPSGVRSAAMMLVASVTRFCISCVVIFALTIITLKWLHADKPFNHHDAC